ncbi:MAG: SDR family oxidoreductase [Bacteroidota bacterium]
MSLFNIEDKVVVITGGTGVLGSAMAYGLAENGAKVAVIGRSLEAGEEVVEQINKKDKEALSFVADVLDEEQITAVREQVLKSCGKIDVLINAAGGNMPGATVTPEGTLLDLSVDEIKKVVELNYLGTVLPTQIFLKHFIEQGHANVINISSMAAQRPLTRVMGYSSSKAAIDNYTKWMAVELAKRHGEHFRVNAMAPGFFLTKQNKSLLTNEDGSLTDRGNTIIDHTPFGRFGNPDELIGTLIWLCSDASKFVSGTVIPVDGGFNAFSGV